MSESIFYEPYQNLITVPIITFTLISIASHTDIVIETHTSNIMIHIMSFKTLI